MIVLLFSPLVDGFAAWLVSKASGCWTDLEVSDVIMNANPKPPSESSHPGVAVKAYEAESGREVETQSGIISVSRDVGKEKEPWQYVLKLHIPPESRGALADVQFVMCTSDGETSKFVGANSGCGGSRAHGRGKDKEGLPFRIEHDAFNEKYGEDGRRLEPNPVQVWAGWATDHAAVQLTEKLTFRLNGIENNGDGDQGNSGAEREAGKPEDRTSGEENEGGGVADKIRPETGMGADEIGDLPAKGQKDEKKVNANLDKAKQAKIMNAMDRMADFRLTGALHHHGTNDESREDIIRNQMGFAKSDAVRENVKKVGEMIKKNNGVRARRDSRKGNGMPIRYERV